MNIFIDIKNKVIIKTSKTKASKYINTNYEDISLNLVVKNVYTGFAPIEINFSCFDIEDIITATQYMKNYQKEVIF